MQCAVPADPPSDVPQSWREMLAALPERGRALVIGPSDCGKSTLGWWLARELAERAGPGAVAVADADVGQSRIGPPACVGWQTLDGTQSEFYFVGATTPQRRPASALEATVRAGRAAADAAWTVVDTTGYVRDELAVALKRAKIKHLRPVHVIALGDDPSLDEILAPWIEDPQVTVHRPAVSDAARSRPRETRAAWRRKQFAAWLRGSNLWPIPREGRRFSHEPPAELFRHVPDADAQLRGLLLGFSDEAGRGICLGLLHTYDFRTGDLIALCPEAACAATHVDFGCLRLERDGTEISRR